MTSFLPQQSSGRRRAFFTAEGQTEGRKPYSFVKRSWCLKTKGEDYLADGLTKCVRLIICVWVRACEGQSHLTSCNANLFFFSDTKNLRIVDVSPCKTGSSQTHGFMEVSGKHKSVLNKRHLFWLLAWWEMRLPLFIYESSIRFNHSLPFSFFLSFSFFLFFFLSTSVRK